MIQERGLIYRVADILLYTILLILVILCVAPFIHVVAVSLSSFKAVSGNSVVLWPIGPHLQNYEYIHGLTLGSVKE